ncbi:MAG: molybdopterin-dependent oxidoreductase [Nocardioidaceae bacterium]
MKRPRLPAEDDFTSPLRGEPVTSRVSIWLGVCFVIAFLTGLLSHFAQTPHSWFTYPTRPVSLYRVTQGLHIISGTAAVPLLLVKLWSVFPKLFARLPLPPRRETLLHLLERVSIAVLMASAIFMLATGLSDSAVWYPFGFSFRAAHYAVSYIAIGSVLVHVAVKLPVVRRGLSTPVHAPTPASADGSTGVTTPTLSRRGLLRTTWAAVGVAVLATAGASVPFLRQVSIFAVRSGTGPQGVPVNRSASSANVLKIATDPGWRLRVTHGATTRHFSRAELQAMPQVTASLPISCVEGWSAGATWTGVRVRDLLARAGAPARSVVSVTSLQPAGSFRQSTLPEQFSEDGDSLIALALNGKVLDLEHGFPCRLITASRPGVLQTKWVSSLDVIA